MDFRLGIGISVCMERLHLNWLNVKRTRSTSTGSTST